MASASSSIAFLNALYISLIRSVSICTTPVSRNENCFLFAFFSVSYNTGGKSVLLSVPPEQRIAGGMYNFMYRSYEWRCRMESEKTKTSGLSVPESPEKKQDYFIFQFLRLFICLITSELLFQFISFQEITGLILIRIILFTGFTAGLSAWIASVLKEKHGNLFAGFMSWILPLYTVTQMEFKNFMGNYMSVKAGGDGAMRILEFVGQFILKIRPVYFLVLVMPLFFSILARKTKTARVYGKKTLRWALALSVVMDLCGVGTVYAGGLQDLYNFPKFIEKALKEFGPGRFLLRDLLALGKTEDYSVITETPTPEPTEEPEPEPEVIHRAFDDTQWIEAMNAEESENIKTVDQYLMNRPITDYNEMTGVLKDKNLIYIMIEAFDYIGLDPVLTPTLVKMKEEGLDFTHHYTPKYSCTTGESEFISEVSLIPESDTCTPNQYRWNTWTQAVFQLFKNAGYHTQGYHNWKDEFYERRTIYANSGCEVYKNFDDMPYTQLWGWQSDYEMMTLTLPEYIDQDRFFTMYVTSSTHFPYNMDSELGNRYLNEINAVHPDYPLEVKRYISKAMELDKAMKYLLDELEKAGKLEDTAIVFFADHHPLNMPLSYMKTYTTELDRYEGLNEDRTPCVIYCPSLKPMKLDHINSTFDILPTTANMFGLNFDPRLYLGNDYFAEDESTVYFTNGDWITDTGIYYNSSGTFEPFEGKTADDAYVQKKNTEVQNLFKISSLIYRNDYFNIRNWIADPKPAQKE